MRTVLSIIFCSWGRAVVPSGPECTSFTQCDGYAAAFSLTPDNTVVEHGRSHGTVNGERTFFKVPISL